MKSTLPKGILVSDTQLRVAPKTDAAYEKWSKNPNNYTDYKLGQSGMLVMHRTERFGWVIATLNISKGRDYGISVDGKICSLGNGPHIKETIRVYLYGDRVKALQPFIDLYNKGLEQANEIRDCRSTRIAQTRARNAKYSGFGNW